MAGEKLAAFFAQRDALVEAFDKKVRKLRKHEILKIAWSQWVSCPVWFRELLQKFQRRYPEITMLCYDLNIAEIVSAQMEGELDFLLTTRYAAKYLPVIWKQRVMDEAPIIRIQNSETVGEAKQRSYAEDAGEGNPEQITMRTRDLCKELHDVLPDVQVFAEMGSVFLNILINGGFAFGLENPEMMINEDFMIHKTQRTATVVLCAPFQTDKRSAALFESFIGEMEAENR